MRRSSILSTAVVGVIAFGIGVAVGDSKSAYRREVVTAPWEVGAEITIIRPTGEWSEDHSGAVLDFDNPTPIKIPKTQRHTLRVIPFGSVPVGEEGKLWLLTCGPEGAGKTDFRLIETTGERP